jgi:hypothetical protein
VSLSLSEQKHPVTLEAHAQEHVETTAQLRGAFLPIRVRPPFREDDMAIKPDSILMGKPVGSKNCCQDVLTPG